MCTFPLSDAMLAGFEAEPVSGGVGEPGTEGGAFLGRGSVDGLSQLGWEGDGPLRTLCHQMMVAQVVGQVAPVEWWLGAGRAAQATRRSYHGARNRRSEGAEAPGDEEGDDHHRAGEQGQVLGAAALAPAATRIEPHA